MKRQWIRSLVWVALASAPLCVQAGTYTVSQTAGAGDFTTISAALAAANADGADDDVIQILDSATYAEDLPRLAGATDGGTLENIGNLTLEAAAGQAPVIEKNAGSDELLRYAPAGGQGTLTVKGAATDKRLVLRNAATVNPVLSTGALTGGAQRVVLQNVIVEKPTSVAGVLLELNNANTAPHELTAVEVRGRDGLNSAYDVNNDPYRCVYLTSTGGATLTDCVIHPNGINQTMTKTNSNNESLKTYGVNVTAANGPVTFTNCTVDTGDANPFSSTMFIAGSAATKVVLDNTTVKGFNDRGLSCDSVLGSQCQMIDSTIGTLGGAGIAVICWSPIAVAMDHTTIANRYAIITSGSNGGSLTGVNGCVINSQNDNALWISGADVTVDLTDTTFSSVKNQAIWLHNAPDSWGAANNATIRLTNLTATDCGAGVIGPDGGLTGVNVTVNGGTITNCGTWEFTVVGGTSTFKDLTINNGLNDRVFQMAGGTAVVDHCTINEDSTMTNTDTVVDFCPFAFHTAGSNLTVSNSTWTGLDAMSGERLLYVTVPGCKANFVNCSFLCDQLLAFAEENLDDTFELTLNGCKIDRSHGNDQGVWFINNGTLKLNMYDCDQMCVIGPHFVFPGSQTVRFIGNIKRTTFYHQANVFVIGDCAAGSALTIDQCDFVEDPGDSGVWVQDSHTTNAVISVTDTNFENQGLAIYNVSTNPNVTADCLVLGGGGNGIAGTQTTNIKDVDSVVYQSTTWGDANYLRLDSTSPALGFNSGNGPETFTGAKGSAGQVNAVRHWAVFE